MKLEEPPGSEDVVNLPEPFAPRVIVPSVVGESVLVLVSVTAPVGMGVVTAVPATVAVKVTVCSKTVVDGDTVKVVAVGSRTGDILPKKVRLLPPSAVVAYVPGVAVVVFHVPLSEP